MSSLKQKLEYLKETKRLIGEAIKSKGGVLTSNFRGYADAIKNLPSGGEKISVRDTGIKFGQSTFTEVPEVFDFTGVTDMFGMFVYCDSLTTIPLIDTSSVTNMDQMFNGCVSLTSIPLIDTSKVTSMYYMLVNCFLLTTIPQLDTSLVTDMSYIFSNCTSLASIPQLDASSVLHVDYMFGQSWTNDLNKLTNIGGFKDLGKENNLSIPSEFLNKCPNLTVESLMNVINNLYDRKTAGYSVVSLNFGSTNLSKLTPEQIQIATDKGWTLV